MGTKLQVDSYLPRYCSMRDLNHDCNTMSWATFYGKNHLSNGQHHCSSLLRAPSDSLPGADKNILKQTILKHESIFKNQVIELHQLYRVQKNLMDGIPRKEQYKHRILYEASSSSSIFPSEMVTDDAQGRNSSRFLFANSVCDGPPVSVHGVIQSSAGNDHKGKSIQASSSPLQKRGSCKDSESRPTKVRRMIDLELPGDEYIDLDEVEQQGNRATLDSEEKLFPSRSGYTTMYQEDASRSELNLPKANTLADLNEPVQSEETSANPSVNFLGLPSQDHLARDPRLPKDFPWNSNRGNMNGTLNNYNNGNHWLSSALKEDGNKENGRSIHHANHPGKASASAKSSHQPAGISPIHSSAKANADFSTFDRTRAFSSYGNGEVVLQSQLPSSVPSSDLANSWDPCWGRPHSCLSQNSSSLQASPYLNPTCLSKSPQSSVRSNEFLGNGWHANSCLLSNPSFAGEASGQNGFYQGSSSGFKELPSHFCKAASDYVNTSYNDRANSLDLNSTGDFNLNVAPPNCLSGEPLSKRGVKSLDSEVKREDPLSVLPWLRPKLCTSSNEAASGRGGEVAKTLDHQNSVVSSCDVDHPSSCKKILGVTILEEPSSGEEEIECGRRKGLLDINLPCDESEDFDNSTTMSEVVVREDKTETGSSNGLSNLIDLNSCVMEEEIPTIDLEAPVDLGTEEDSSHRPPLESPLQDSTDSADQERATVAAEAIIAISSYAANKDVTDTVVGPSEDALAWFVDIVCSSPDDIKSSPNFFEEMTLKLIECTAEEYFPSPPVFNFPTVDETGPANVPGRTRRGPARRGRQRREFQRDILPSLVSLARHEVTEDIQTFGGLMRATGHAWHCGTRRNARNGSGRRRRRSVVASSPPPLESTSLTSWGKTTRRPRRQRCSTAVAGKPAPIALT